MEPRLGTGRLRYPRIVRIGVLSDIHANLPALEAVLAAMPSVDAIWQLGDIVGYGPHPDQIVARLREAGASGVRGNHDAAALGELDLEAFNSDARRAIEWTRSVVSEDTLGWLRSLPTRVELEGFTLVHGSPRDPTWEYVTSTPVARAGIAAMTTPSGLHGHTHVPIVFILDDGRLDAIGPADGSRLTIDGRRVLVNPGSVGQPRDGIPTASWLILDTDADAISWHRTAYDVEAVQRAMIEVELPVRLVERLSYGL